MIGFQASWGTAADTSNIVNFAADNTGSSTLKYGMLIYGASGVGPAFCLFNVAINGTTDAFRSSHSNLSTIIGCGDTVPGAYVTALNAVSYNHP